MRKHRLSGVVIAVLIGLGVFAHWPDTAHRTPGAGRAGIQLASADLPAGRTAAAAPTTAAALPPDAGRRALFDLVISRAVASLSSPFGTPALVWDVRVAELTQRAEGVAARAAMAQRQAETKAYFDALVAARSRPAPVVAARSSVPPPAPAPAVVPATRADPFVALRDCESGGNYGDDTGNGYYGAYQFTLGTWRSLGFGGLPSQAPAAVQDQAAQELQARRGWGQWPSCARRLGLT
jgi:hypothetical protein